MKWFTEYMIHERRGLGDHGLDNFCFYLLCRVLLNESDFSLSIRRPLERTSCPAACLLSLVSLSHCLRRIELSQQSVG